MGERWLMEKSDSLKGLICDTRMLTLGTAHGFSALKLMYTQVLVAKPLMAPLATWLCVYMLKSAAGEMSLLPLTKIVGQHARVKRSKWGSPCWEGLSWMGCVKCHCACLGRFYKASNCSVGRSYRWLFLSYLCGVMGGTWHIVGAMNTHCPDEQWMM